MRNERQNPGNLSLDELLKQNAELESQIARLQQQKASIATAITSQKSGITQASFLELFENKAEQLPKTEKTSKRKKRNQSKTQLEMPELKAARVKKTEKGIVLPCDFFTEEELKSFDPWVDDAKWKNVVDQALAYYIFYHCYSSKFDRPVLLRFMGKMFGDLFKYDGRELLVFLGCRDEQGVINRARRACMSYKNPIEGENKHLAALVTECKNNPEKYTFLSPRKFAANLVFKIQY